MAVVNYKTNQIATTTDGAATTLATVPASHEYVGTVGLCYVASSGASTTARVIVTTGGSATTESYRAYDVELVVGDSLDYTLTLDAGKVLSVSSPVGNVAAHFNYQDWDIT